MANLTSLPKVVLHDHLDGGLRPATVLELAHLDGYKDLPADTEEELAAWFDQSHASSLSEYLRAFTHTIGVMQTPHAIERVAYEAMIDHSDNGVVLAESRFAPSQHITGDMSMQDVIASAAEGFRTAADETGISWTITVDALRDQSDSLEVSQVAASMQDFGVTGFDLAGPEVGHPVSKHVPAIVYAIDSGLRVTLHAGEEGGPGALIEALTEGRAERIGHGNDIIEDCVIAQGAVQEVGPSAAYVRDRLIPLEVSVQSNLHTRRWRPDQHPVALLHRSGFQVTLNTDNRLMSQTSMSHEFELVAQHHGFTIDDFASVTARAVRAAFTDVHTKRALWTDKIWPVYEREGAARPQISW